MQVRLSVSIAEELIINEVNRWTKKTSPYRSTLDRFSSDRDYAGSICWDDISGSWHTCWMRYDLWGKPMTYNVSAYACDWSHSGRNDFTLQQIYDAIASTLSVKSKM